MPILKAAKYFFPEKINQIKHDQNKTTVTTKEVYTCFEKRKSTNYLTNYLNETFQKQTCKSQEMKKSSQSYEHKALLHILTGKKVAYQLESKQI